jgi:hypothetical protein
MSPGVDEEAKRTFFGLRSGCRGLICYVAYVDLRAREPRIQYRLPISSLIALILFWGAPSVLVVGMAFRYPAAGLGAAFMLGLLVLFHMLERHALLWFLRQAMRSRRGRTAR